MIRSLKKMCQKANGFQHCSEDKVFVAIDTMCLMSLDIFNRSGDRIHIGGNGGDWKPESHNKRDVHSSTLHRLVNDEKMEDRQC